MTHKRRTTTRFMRRASTALLSAAALVASLALTAPAAQAVTPTIPDGVLATTQLGVGFLATCGTTTQKTIVCWGATPEALVSGGEKADSVRRALPVSGTVLEGKAISEVKVGGSHFCALATDATLACWGRNLEGQLGDGTTTGRLRPVAVDFSGTPMEGKVVKDFSLGHYVTCAVAVDDVIACWGRFLQGIYGSKATAIDVSGTALEGKAIAGLDVDLARACAWTTDGVAACWGEGSTVSRPYLGDGTSNASTKPVAVTTSGSSLDGQVIVQVDVQQLGACALGANGSVACWGVNVWGQLAGPRRTEALAPVDRSMADSPLEGKHIVRVSGAYQHTCAVASDGTLACWGAGAGERLGNGSTDDSEAPVAVTLAGTPFEGRPIADVGVSFQFSCARATDGTTGCWGPGGPLLGRGGLPSTRVPGGVVGAISVPDAPTVMDVTGTSATSASIAWTPADEDGGLPRTGYTVTASPDGGTKHVGADNTTATFTRLTPGVAYSFAVKAENVLGSSAAAIGALQGSSLTLVPSTQRITVAGSAMLSGSLRDSTGLPLAGRTVTLHRAVWPATIQTPFAVVITNANGNYSTVVRPTKATTYSASFVGARGLTGRISTPAHVVVVPKVTLRLNDSTARLGQKVVFSGGVSPGAQGRTVYLQRAIKGRWTHASTATVTSRGTFAFAWKPTSTVDYTFRVVLPAGNGWSMGTSNTRRLVVS